MVQKYYNLSVRIWSGALSICMSSADQELGYQQNSPDVSSILENAVYGQWLRSDATAGYFSK